MLTTKELGLEPSLKEEDPICSICCEELTVKNIVNPECGHATCKECFWRWAKDKNSCPFCRTSLLKNDEEAQDIQQMRQLLEHRTRIIRQVEDAYDEEETLKQKANRLRKRLGNMEEAYEGAKSLVKKQKEKLEELKRINGGSYQTLKHLQEQQKAVDEFNRKNRDKIDLASANLAHGDKGMCMEVLRDIKILGRAAGGPWEYGWFCKPKLDKVREMNKVRKERMEQRRIIDSANRCYSCCSLGLRELFDEDEHVPATLESLFGIDRDEFISSPLRRRIRRRTSREREAMLDGYNLFDIFQQIADVSDNVIIRPNTINLNNIRSGSSRRTRETLNYLRNTLNQDDIPELE